MARLLGRGVTHLPPLLLLLSCFAFSDALNCSAGGHPGVTLLNPQPFECIAPTDATFAWVESVPWDPTCPCESYVLNLTPLNSSTEVAEDRSLLCNSSSYVWDSLLHADEYYSWTVSSYMMVEGIANLYCEPDLTIVHIEWALCGLNDVDLSSSASHSQSTCDLAVDVLSCHQDIREYVESICIGQASCAIAAPSILDNCSLASPPFYIQVKAYCRRALPVSQSSVSLFYIYDVPAVFPSPISPLNEPTTACPLLSWVPPTQEQYGEGCGQSNNSVIVFFGTNASELAAEALPPDQASLWLGEAGGFPNLPLGLNYWRVAADNHPGQQISPLLNFSVCRSDCPVNMSQVENTLRCPSFEHIPQCYEDWLAVDFCWETPFVSPESFESMRPQPKDGERFIAFGAIFDNCTQRLSQADIPIAPNTRFFSFWIYAGFQSGQALTDEFHIYLDDEDIFMLDKNNFYPYYTPGNITAESYKFVFLDISTFASRGGQHVLEFFHINRGPGSLVFIDLVSIGSCHNFEIEECSYLVVDDKCSWCPYGGGCVELDEYGGLCPSCSSHDYDFDCCEFSGGCRYCFLNDSCVPLTKEACTACSSKNSAECTGDCIWCATIDTCIDRLEDCIGCNALDFDNCTVYQGCLWCGSLGTCLENKHPSDCPGCSTFSRLDCDNVAEGCEWCPSDDECISNGMCKACEIYDSECTQKPGCFWCSEGLMCLQLGDFCDHCLLYNSSSRCQLGGCHWCENQMLCRNSSGVDAHCQACEEIPFDDCIIHPGCAPCASSLNCLFNEVFCPDCRVLSKSNCSSLLGCQFCPSFNSCVYMKDDACPGCDTMLLEEDCNAILPGCFWCRPELECMLDNNSSQCTNCRAVSDSSMCTSPGCSWCLQVMPTGCTPLSDCLCEYNTETVCDIVANCSWCPAYETCLGSTDVCPRCNQSQSESSCLSLQGCSWCMADLACELHSVPCPLCNEFPSDQREPCSLHSGCQFCEVDRTCARRGDIHCLMCDYIPDVCKTFANCTVCPLDSPPCKAIDIPCSAFCQDLNSSECSDPWDYCCLNDGVCQTDCPESSSAIVISPSSSLEEDSKPTGWETYLVVGAVAGTAFAALFFGMIVGIWCIVHAKKPPAESGPQMVEMDQPTFVVIPEAEGAGVTDTMPPQALDDPANYNTVFSIYPASEETQFGANQYLSLQIPGLGESDSLPVDMDRPGFLSSRITEDLGDLSNYE